MQGAPYHKRGAAGNGFAGGDGEGVRWEEPGLRVQRVWDFAAATLILNTDLSAIATAKTEP